MEYSGAAAYVNAKASGMLGKAFVGSRASRLFSVKSLPELWTLVFNTEVPLMPQAMLGQKIEEEAEKRFIDQFTSLVEMYSNPHRIFTVLLHYYDIENLKEIGAALASKEPDMPHITELGSYSLLNYKAWPDIAAMTKGTPLAWYNKVPDIHEQQHLDAKLDNQYVRMMWEAASECEGEIREPVMNFFRERFVMTNIIWALRLRVYYEMNMGEILEHLACAGAKPTRSDPLCGPAVEILDKRLDTFEDWEHWKYARMLNPHEEGVIWKIDPRWVENAYKSEINARAERLFHEYPLTDMVLISWFRIKQHECDIIRTAAEGIRLNADTAEAMKFAGVTAAAE